MISIETEESSFEMVGREETGEGARNSLASSKKEMEKVVLRLSRNGLSMHRLKQRGFKRVTHSKMSNQSLVV